MIFSSRVELVLPSALAISISRESPYPKTFPEKASPLVKEFVRRKFGLKRVVVSNIQITKQSGVYTVTYNQHSTQLH